MANETTTAPVQTSAPVPAQAPVAAQAQAAAPAPAEHVAGGEHGAVYNPKMPEPQIINGVKVYPTSYIPARAELHYPKKMLVEMQEWHIEVVHILVFFIVLFALFIGPWKRPNHR